MKIALLGDAHANLPALDAVLADAAQNSAEATWNLGDFVGYGAFPEETVIRLRGCNALSILGNYDRKVLQVPQKNARWKAKKRPEKWLAFKWTFDRLSRASRSYLISLPEQRSVEAGGLRFLMVHGSPASRNEHLSPDTPPNRLQKLADSARADLILCAHSHIPFARQAGSTWFINPGSVGRSDDGDPRASYALLTVQRGLVNYELRRVEYDTARAAAAIRQASLPEDFAQMVLLGRSLDWIQANHQTVNERQPDALQAEELELSSASQPEG
jgi:putative phosphoesterase